VSPILIPPNTSNIDKFSHDNQLNYTANQVLVSCGGKQSFFNLTQALLNQGDEVIIPAPYWVSYPDMVLLADGKPVFIEADMVLNSPSNPSGIAYSQKELAALGQVLLKHPDILVATDDMYEHILWADEPFSNIVMACPELYAQTIVLNW